MIEAPIWVPSAQRRAESRLTEYLEWLEREKGLKFADYDALWRWSVDELEAFWESIWQFFGVRASQPCARVLDARRMPGAKWFEGARLNLAENAFRHATASRPALVFRSEIAPLTEVSWAELEREVARVAGALRAMGVAPGDRVAAFVPNIPQAMIAFLACASLGAIWSSCAPDMGAASVLERFRQIDPKVLIAVDGYRTPQIIDLAGGIDVLGFPGEPSEQSTWETVAAAAPRVVVAMPCGYDAERSQAEAKAHADPLRTVGAERVVAVDASAYFSRPGPRLVDGLELMAHILHPDLVPEPAGAVLEVEV